MIDSSKSFPVFLSADIPDMARNWRNNKNIRMWCRQYSLISIYNHHEWIIEQSEDPEIKMFGISVHDVKAKPKNPSKVPFTEVGVCGLTSIDLINRNAEFSLYIAVKMFESLGMKKEGTLKRSYYRDGEFIDSYIYAILKDEYSKKGCMKIV